jgi:hypothetical protein
MDPIDERSLYRTVTNAAAFLLDGGRYTGADKRRLTGWIIAHQNRDKKFIFYPTPGDQESGILLLSGEKPRTKLLTGNAVELETLRLLALIAQAPQVGSLFRQADERLAGLCFANVCTTGECAAASIAFLRYRTARDADGSAAQIAHALDVLRQFRKGDGQWRFFPFYFTLLWLIELSGGLARDELAYARNRCERLAARVPPAAEPTSAIRNKILQLALTQHA